MNFRTPARFPSLTVKGEKSSALWTEEQREQGKEKRAMNNPKKRNLAVEGLGLLLPKGTIGQKVIENLLKEHSRER